MSIKNKELFSTRLRDLRKEKNLTMKKLGELVELSEQAISQYERGLRLPKHEIICAFSDLFDVDLEYLEGSSDKKNFYVISSFSSNFDHLLQEIAIKDDIPTNNYLSQILSCLNSIVKSSLNDNSNELCLFKDYIGMFYEYTCKLSSSNKDISTLEFLNNEDVLTRFNELISIINTSKGVDDGKL